MTQYAQRRPATLNLALSPIQSRGSLTMSGEQFTAEGAHFESEYYLTLTYLPPAEAEEKVKGWMFEGQSRSRSVAARQAVDRFSATIEAFENVFGQLFRVERLRGGGNSGPDRQLQYIHRCVTGHDHPIACPEIPIHLNDLLASEDFVGGIEPRIGGAHIQVLAIDGLPRNSSPGMLRALDSIPIEYRWNTRAILIDPEEARRCWTRRAGSGAPKSEGGKTRSSVPRMAPSISLRRKWPLIPSRRWASRAPATFSSRSTRRT